MLSATDFKFIQHVATQNLSYATVEEYDARKGLFVMRDNMFEIENAKVENTYKLGHNEFSTWTDFELDQIRGYVAFTGVSTSVTENLSLDIPSSVDWRTAGAVTPVKNQGQCGSCWSFSSTGAMEGAWQIKTGTLLSISEQELVDCDHNGSQGCNGGSMEGAFQWYETNKCETEASYAYTAKNGTCMESSYTGQYNTTGYSNVTANSPDALKTAIAKGPVSVAIEADKMCFQYYHSGIMNNTACGTQLDHGVLAVGYGTDPSPYYIVKNSWASTWGDQGYIKLAIVDGAGICGIQMQPVYPIV